MAPRIFAPAFLLLLSVSSGCSGKTEYANWEHGGNWGGQLEAAGSQVMAAGGHNTATGGASSASGGSVDLAGVGGRAGGEDDGTGGAKTGSGAVENGTGGLDNETERDCENEDTQARSCGLNDRGQSERVCSHGVWGAWALCIDPDQCEDGEWRKIPCEQPGPKTLQPQECLLGAWLSKEGCILPCEEGLTYDSLLDACTDSVGCVPRDAPFGGGNGTPEDPYTICSVAHLQALTTSPDSHFILAQSLDLANALDFTPLGTVEAPFSGTLDGRGRILAHLTVNREISDNVGLFGWIDGGEVVDLILQDVEVHGRDFVGALAGQTLNAAYVEAVTIDGGEVEGRHDVGGLIGHVEESTVSESSASVPVLGFREWDNARGGVGGLLGSMDASTVGSSSALGAVAGYDAVGGLVGRAYNSAISGSHAMGAVLGKSDLGGLVGDLQLSTIAGCQASGIVTAQDEHGAVAGGLIGNIGWSTVTDCFALGDVHNSVSAGGLGGRVSAGSTVLRSSASGSVTGPTMLGGLVGQFIASTVSDCSATGDVAANAELDIDRQWVGGLVGYSHVGILQDSFASGAVSGVDAIGGLIGEADEASSVSKCYALGEASGTMRVGGLVGVLSESEVSQSYASGNVSGKNSIGGLLGNTWDAAISHAYALGSVQGERSVGGLIGSMSYVNISESYSLGHVSGNLEVGALVGYLYLRDEIPVRSSFAREQGTIALVGYVENGGSATDSAVDSALLPVSTFAEQEVFSNVGWDFENAWTMSTGHVRPVFLWQPE